MSELRELHALLKAQCLGFSGLIRMMGKTPGIPLGLWEICR
jgi:hypothetical protein